MTCVRAGPGTSSRRLSVRAAPAAAAAPLRGRARASEAGCFRFAARTGTPVGMLAVDAGARCGASAIRERKPRRVLAQVAPPLQGLGCGTTCARADDRYGIPGVGGRLGHGYAIYRPGRSGAMFTRPLTSDTCRWQPQPGWAIHPPHPRDIPHRDSNSPGRCGCPEHGRSGAPPACLANSAP